MIAAVFDGCHHVDPSAPKLDGDRPGNWFAGLLTASNDGSPDCTGWGSAEQRLVHAGLGLSGPPCRPSLDIPFRGVDSSTPDKGTADRTGAVAIMVKRCSSSP